MTVRLANGAKVLLVEDDHRGHRLSYVRLLSMYCARQGWSVRLLTTAAVRDSETFELHLGGLDSALDVSLTPEVSYSGLIAASREWKADVTVVPDGDDWLAPVARDRGWSGAGKISLLVMRDSVQGQSSPGRLAKNVAKKMLIATLRRFRDVSVLVLSSSLDVKQDDSRFVADPISFAPDVDSAKKILEVNPHVKPGMKWVTVAGAITARKNLPLVLQAAQSVSDDNLGIVIAGKMDPDVQSSISADLRLLEERRVPVVVVDRLLNDGELDGILALSHAVVLAHSNEGPSGILGKAVRAGSFVVAAGARSLRADCRSLKRAVWTELSPHDVARGITYALNEPSSTTERVADATDFCRALIGVPWTPC